MSGGGMLRILTNLLDVFNNGAWARGVVWVKL